MQDANTRYWVRSSGLGIRPSALIRYRVSGTRCQVAGTRYLAPDTWMKGRDLDRIPGACPEKPAHGVCRIGGVYVACSIGDPSLSPTDFETVSLYRFAMGPGGTPK
jgi:hypothetical protein